jgi:hypothetical protein
MSFPNPMHINNVMYWNSTHKMETTTTKKTTKKDFRKLILEGFVNHVLEHGIMPKSVFKFAKDLKKKRSFILTSLHLNPSNPPSGFRFSKALWSK